MKDEPAFPQENYQSQLAMDAYTGLTKRELFAAMAMQGVVTSYSIHKDDLAIYTAGVAVELADALIKELEESE